VRLLHSKTLIAEKRETLFDFFCKAENLEVLSPPWLKFRILTKPPIEMAVGTLIDYPLKIKGIPVKWRTEITDWNPPYSFTDSQIKGPYRVWIHEHRFEEVEEGTLMHDIVQFKSPGWFLEPAIHAMMIKPDLKQIFSYRIVEFGKRYPVLNQTLEIDGEAIAL